MSTPPPNLPPRPTPPPQVSGTGWGFLKVIGLILAMLIMIGFGLCGLCGIVLGVSDRSMADAAIPMGLIGLAIATAFFFVVRAILRSGKPPK